MMSVMQTIAAQDSDTTAADIESRVKELVALLPGIEYRLASMKPDILLQLANDRQAVAQKLLHLKCVFPGADCGKLLVKELGLMRESEESLRARAVVLREMLPDLDVDKLVQVCHPSFLPCLAPAAGLACAHSNELIACLTSTCCVSK
jgi:hypothetical protein